MARQPRLAVPGYAHHIIQRGNNRQAIFTTLSSSSFQCRAVPSGRRSTRSGRSRVTNSVSWLTKMMVPGQPAREDNPVVRSDVHPRAASEEAAAAVAAAGG